MEKGEVKHWFEMEIALAEERMKIGYNPMFNGVEVGHEKQIELNKAHIRYCEYAIKALCKEETKMCEVCKCGKGNLFELKSETIHFGNIKLPLDLIFGFEESGKGKIIAALFDGDGYPIKETAVYTKHCPMCGRKLEK